MTARRGKTDSHKNLVRRAHPLIIQNQSAMHSRSDANPAAFSRRIRFSRTVNCSIPSSDKTARGVLRPNIASTNISPYRTGRSCRQNRARRINSAQSASSSRQPAMIILRSTSHFSRLKLCFNAWAQSKIKLSHGSGCSNPPFSPSKSGTARDHSGETSSGNKNRRLRMRSRLRGWV